MQFGRDRFVHKRESNVGIGLHLIPFHDSAPPQRPADLCSVLNLPEVPVFRTKASSDETSLS